MEITTKQVPQLSSQTPTPPQDFEECNGLQHSQVNSLPAWDQREALFQWHCIADKDVHHGYSRPVELELVENQWFLSIHWGIH